MRISTPMEKYRKNEENTILNCMQLLPFLTLTLEILINNFFYKSFATF
jgi:hypothetical protein